MRKFEMSGLLGPMRLPFLTLVPACVLLGVAVAAFDGGELNATGIWLAMLGALAAGIAVNALNEYVDFRSGLDEQTVRTPFSGGSGTLPARPDLARPTLVMAWLSLGVVVAIGAWLLNEHGLTLLPIGVAGIALIVFYSTRIVRWPLVCLFAPGLGFGTLMVLGTTLAAGGEITPTAFAASLVPLFLVNNLLLLNQFPDVEADRAVGRKTLPIAIGRRSAIDVYLLFALLGALSLGISIWAGWLPVATAIGGIGFALTVPVFFGARRNARDVDGLKPWMAMNTVICLATTLLVAGALYFSA
jgi:1,4-dihydroxy-2-naphthoate octaprenyltransferase